VAAAACALALPLMAACGGGDDDASATTAPSVTTTPTVPTDATTAGTTPTAPDAGSAQTVEIPAADQGLAFATTEADAEAGEITLRMPNPSPLPHNIAVDEPEQVIGEVVDEGGVSEITFTAPAGTYEYYCSVPGHREGGMVGTLTVT
jgi:plastocyanin